MAAKTIAYITDAHLGQKIILEDDIEGRSRNMRYDNNAEENKDNLKRILDGIAGKGITDIIFGGDIGTKEANKLFFDMIYKFGFKLLMVLGNHDTYSEVNKYYRADRGNHNELHYSREDDYFKYIYLDSSSNSISPVQFNWLKQELDSEKKIVIFIHHPVLEIKTPLDKIGAALKGREEIKNVLLTFKKEIIIFCGHYHMIDELTEGNIRQYSSPACSYQIQKLSEMIEIDNSTFGYRLINIEGNRINTEVKLFR
jgi:Icc protein